jgi:hypothetical protein
MHGLQLVVGYCLQDEFKFYLEDASSKLLIVPSGGNSNAEAAAADLGVPVATFSIAKGVCMAMLPPSQQQ